MSCDLGDRIQRAMRMMGNYIHCHSREKKILMRQIYFLFTGFSAPYRIFGQDVSEGSGSACHRRRTSAPPLPSTSWIAEPPSPTYAAVSELAHMIYRLGG